MNTKGRTVLELEGWGEGWEIEELEDERGVVLLPGIVTQRNVHARASTFIPSPLPPTGARMHKTYAGAVVQVNFFPHPLYLMVYW